MIGMKSEARRNNSQWLAPFRDETQATGVQTAEGALDRAVTSGEESFATAGTVL
jgi:hypothetical protein